MVKALGSARRSVTVLTLLFTLSYSSPLNFLLRLLSARILLHESPQTTPWWLFFRHQCNRIGRYQQLGSYPSPFSLKTNALSTELMGKPTIASTSLGGTTEHIHTITVTIHAALQVFTPNMIVQYIFLKYLTFIKTRLKHINSLIYMNIEIPKFLFWNVRLMYVTKHDRCTEILHHKWHESNADDNVLAFDKMIHCVLKTFK